MGRRAEPTEQGCGGTVSGPLHLRGRDISVTPDDVEFATRRVREQSKGTVLGGVAAVLLATGLAAALSEWVVRVDGVERIGLQMAIVALLVAPLFTVLAARAKKAGIRTAAFDHAVERAMQVDARRREFEGSLGRALEMAGSEDEVFGVTAEALGLLALGAPVELLLADSSHSHLERRVSFGPDGDGPGCTVADPSGCPATRQSRTMTFASSTALDACPRLKERCHDSPRAAVCVPTAIAGRSVGVIHVTTPDDAPVSRVRVAGLGSVAAQFGSALGMMRLMSDTRLQASTDALTGLLNRRSLENHVKELTDQGTTYVAVLADLDRFKQLNDRHGHQAGDRAIRQFADVMRACVRQGDVIGRYGGEEFVIVLPGTEVDTAVEIIERIRTGLGHLAETGDHPRFTASFGVAAPLDDDDFHAAFQRADRALLEAKEAGRDRFTIAA